MKISILIPAFNEEKTILKVLNRIKETKISNLEYQIIVINDGSTDGTKKILEDNKDLYNLLINNDRNSGKGFSIKKGIDSSEGDVVLIQDADLEYDPKNYETLLEPFILGVADVVFGSRFIGSDKKRVLYFWHTIGNKFLTLLSNIFTNLNLTDMEVGYKVFKTDIVKNINLEENRFGFEPEITAKIAKRSLRIYEVGISYFGRKYADGKKITWKDGFSAIRCILKYNLLK